MLFFFIILNAIKYFLYTQGIKYTKKNKIRFHLAEIMQ